MLEKTEWAIKRKFRDPGNNEHTRHRTKINKTYSLFIYSRTCPCGHLYYVVTCLKRSPFSCPAIEHFIWIKPLLRGHLSYKATFTLFQRWPLNTGLTVYSYSLISIRKLTSGPTSSIITMVVTTTTATDSRLERILSFIDYWSKCSFTDYSTSLQLFKS